jgi:hypothetical protein
MEQTTKDSWVASHLLDVLLRCLCDEKTQNGHVGSQQILVWLKDGEELARSEGGKRTYTTKFKELCHQITDKLFEEVRGNT